jgi:hypothetical protein
MSSSKSRTIRASSFSTRTSTSDMSSDGEWTAALPPIRKNDSRIQRLRTSVRCFAALAVVAMTAMGCGAGSSSSPTGINGSIGQGVTRGTVEQWKERWCQAAVGMSPSEIQDLMGTPTEDYMGAKTPAGFEPQMIWEAGKWHFTAFFSDGTRADDLDVNTYALTDADQASVGCDLSRRG